MTERNNSDFLHQTVSETERALSIQELLTNMKDYFYDIMYG